VFARRNQDIIPDFMLVKFVPCVTNMALVAYFLRLHLRLTILGAPESGQVQAVAAGMGN
jgi:hypothetical protein